MHTRVGGRHWRGVCPPAPPPPHPPRAYAPHCAGPSEESEGLAGGGMAAAVGLGRAAAALGRRLLGARGGGGGGGAAARRRALAGGRGSADRGLLPRVEERAAALARRLAEVEGELARGEGDSGALHRELARLGPAAEAAKELRRRRDDLAGLRALAGDAAEDPELRALAREEEAEAGELLRAAEDALQGAVAAALVPHGQARAEDGSGLVLEVAAGAGGEEAALFAGDLVRMYERYCQARGWRAELVGTAGASGRGGVREATLAVAGGGCFKALQYESGVHRVQRVPQTESGGRVHTSTVSVAVLPEADERELSIPDGDLRFETFRSSGAGGQHVNTTESAVRVVHVPSGVTVTIQDERSQHKNKAKALKVLRARLADARRQELATERSEARMAQMGTRDRSERVRTYNFPQGRVTDHRIGLSSHDLPGFLEGGAGGPLAEFAEALDREAGLARLERALAAAEP